MEEEEAEESEKSEYFYRLIHLVYDLGTEVLLKLFKIDIPQGLTVEDFLKSKKNVSKLKELEKKRVFNKNQIEILDETPPDVSRFDISLLCILIINLTNIQQPCNGWKQTSLLPSDRSAGAQLIRLRLIRNEAIAHRSKTTMKKSDFETFWKRTENILVHLAGEVSQAEKDHVEEKIEEFKTIQLVEDQHCKLNTQILGTLQEDIEMLKQKIEEQESMSEDVDTVTTSLDILEVQLKDLENNMRKIEDVSRKVDEHDSRIHALEDKSKSQEVQFTFPAADNENDQKKRDLQKELVNHYRRNGYCKMSIAALIDDEQVDIEQLFVEPLMKRVKHDSFSKSASDKNGQKDTLLVDIFREEGRVCVSGNAGQGKTTMCQMIVSSWCNVHDNNEHVPDIYEQFLKPFDYLFYIPLRNHSISGVVEMIETGLVRIGSHGVLKEVLENESEKCLIILDGLDEWMPSEECQHRVPYIDPRETFTVLITSRPWKLETLRPKMSEIGQEVTLCGINEDHIVEGMVKLLNKKYSKCKDWWVFKSSEQYKKAKHLAEIPIILTQMVCMWYDNEEFGDTRVEIYCKMVDYLFNVAFKRDKEGVKPTYTTLVQPQKSTNTKLVNVFKGCSRCEEYSELLSKLSYLAFHTLFNEGKENSLVFLHSVTELYKLTEDDVKFCLSVGILSQSKFSGKVNSQLKKLSFLHKTVQEFLAAICIAYVGEDTCFHSMVKRFISLDDVLEMSQVLIFLSGLKPDLLDNMSRHVAQLTDKDERVLQYRSSLWKDNSFTSSIQYIILSCIDEVSKNKNMDCKVVLNDYLSEMIEEQENMIHYLDLAHVKSFQQDECNFCTEPSGNDIVKLCVNINSQEHICHLTSIVERCVLPLKCFSVKGLMDIVILDDLLIALNKVCHLTCFQLSCLILTHLDIENLGGFLSHNTELREIILQNICCNTCEEELCNYRIDLSHHKQLQYLKIHTLHGDIVLSDEIPLEHCEIYMVKCDVSVINRLKFSASLQRLNVIGHIRKYTNTTTVHSEEGDNPSQLCLYKVLIDVIPTLKNLRILNLELIEFKQDMLTFSPDMTSLKKVFIDHCRMTLQCLKGFIGSLPQTQLEVSMSAVDICPKYDLSAAVKYITDRFTPIICYDYNGKSMKHIRGAGTEHDEDYSIHIGFCSRPHQ